MWAIRPRCASLKPRNAPFNRRFDLTVGEAKVQQTRGACVGGMDQRAAFPVGDAHEAALQWPFRMRESGHPPQGGKPFRCALNALNDKIGPEPGRNRAQVRPGMRSSRQRGSWTTLHFMSGSWLRP